jgi:glycosyltransferase involved in cell wall biosynthesis
MHVTPPTLQTGPAGATAARKRPREGAASHAAHEVTLTFAFVTLELYPVTAGGTGILLHHTIKALLASGAKIVLYLDLSDSEIKEFDLKARHAYPNVDNLTYYNVGEIRRSMQFFGQIYDDQEQSRSVAFAHAILTTQDRHAIDLIEFYDYCGPAFHYLSYNREQRRPVAVRFHNTVEIIQRGTRSAFSRPRLINYAMERSQLTLADVVLVPGANFLRDEVRKLYGTELVNQNIVLSSPIHNSIGEIAYTGLSRNILFYGRLSTFKGLDTFVIGAVLALRDAAFREWVNEFVIVGPEETVASALTLEEIRGFIPADLLAKFRFVGRVRHTQLMPLLQDISFACFANRMESFCYAAHELYTAGIPLILSDKPAFRDHFADDQVVFFDGTAGGLAASITSLAANPDKLRALSQGSRDKPENSNVQSYVDAVGIARQRWAAAPAAPAGQHREIVTILILSNGDLAAEQVTLQSLAGLSSSVHLLRLDAEGQIMFSGLRWTPGPGDDVLLPAAAICMFVRAGDICHGDIIREAALHMREDDRVGAMAFWCEIDGRVRCASHAFVPEFASITGPGLRTLIRVGEGLTILELLRSNSFTDEMSLLLAQRALSRGLVEKPVIGVTITHAIALPPVAANFAIDFDRMSPAYLALARDLIVPAADGAKERDILYRQAPDHADLLSIRATSVFSEGELWVLRIFPHRAAMHAPWTTVQQSGDWTLINESHSPAGGAWKTLHGEMSFWADEHYGIEFLWGPFCSGAEIRFRDCLYRLNLRTDHVTSSIIWLDELTRGLSQAPVAERLPVAAIGRSVLSNVTQAWIGANMRATTRRLIISRAPSAPSDSAADTAVATLADLFGTASWTAADLAFAMLAATKLARRCTVYLPFGLAQGAEAADILLHKKSLPLVIDTEGDAIGAFDQGFYPRLAKWCGVLDRHHGDISVRGSDETILFSLAAHGAKTVKSNFRLKPCPYQNIDGGGEIDLIILRSDGLIDNVVHMIAGAAFATMLGTTIATLYLEEGQWHAANICETLAAARNYAIYTSLERVMALPRNRPIIACAIYPEPVMPAQAMKALSLGAPTLVGPVGQSAEFRAALRDMSVIYWEDSRDIGHAIMKLATDGQSVVDAYNKIVSTALAGTG